MQTPAPVLCPDWLRRATRAALLVIALWSFAVPGTAVPPWFPTGVWLINGKGRQSFDCSGLLCGLTILQELQPAGNPLLQHRGRSFLLVALQADQ